MASKKRAPKVVKDPTRYVAISLEEYTSGVNGSTCNVRECNGDDLEASIEAVANYSGDIYVVVAEIKRVVRVPSVKIKDAPSLKDVPVEVLGDKHSD